MNRGAGTGAAVSTEEEPAHFAHWPPGLSRHLTLPQTSVVYNAEVSARRYPDKPFLLYYGTPLTFGRFFHEVERLAGYLQQCCGVQRGDRVLLNLQNSPQWAVACYAILRADAVVVPLNPMNRTAELEHYARDSGARVAILAGDGLPAMLPLHGPEPAPLQHLVVARYRDYTDNPDDLPLPDCLSMAPLALPDRSGLHAWSDALAAGRAPAASGAGPDDPCLMPYTSGTTGMPRGCLHTHRSVQATAIGGITWFGRTADTVLLSVLPYFHVTGLSGGLNGPLYAGATVVVMSRWDRDLAARLIERHRVQGWQAISTMVVDFLAHPDLDQFDLSSLDGLRGGGAAMPEAVAERLRSRLGVDYVEGYGLSETMAATHINPPHRPRAQCLGIPVFDVVARILDPETGRPVATGAVGELVIHGPQVMQQYWGDPAATAAAFTHLEGRRYLRTGDLVRQDADGYFFMVDRLKRMINASGFKVWPAEVESMLYRHPDIHEVCVIAAPDAHRGETVRALVVLRPGRADHVHAADIITWAREAMAAYKVPREVHFVEALPKSGSGKILWRALQDEAFGRNT